jgi:hypothetical protein
MPSIRAPRIRPPARCRWPSARAAAPAPRAARGPRWCPSCWPRASPARSLGVPRRRGPRPSARRARAPARRGGPARSGECSESRGNSWRGSSEMLVVAPQCGHCRSASGPGRSRTWVAGDRKVRVARVPVQVAERDGDRLADDVDLLADVAGAVAVGAAVAGARAVAADGLLFDPHPCILTGRRSADRSRSLVSACTRRARSSESGTRQCPPGVRTPAIWPSRSQRLTLATAAAQLLGRFADGEQLGLHGARHAQNVPLLNNPSGGVA